MKHTLMKIHLDERVKGLKGVINDAIEKDLLWIKTYCTDYEAYRDYYYQGLEDEGIEYTNGNNNLG